MTGMHCSACSTAVEHALAALPGVRSAAVSLTMQQADIVRAPGGASEVRPHPARPHTLQSSRGRPLGDCARWQPILRIPVSTKMVVGHNHAAEPSLRAATEYEQ